ncbi:MAG: hypothetical protein ACREJ0_20055 [Geminicoccaceae bacterium]
MRPAVILAMLAALVLTACQERPAPQFQVEESRSYALSKEAVWNDILAFLRANDITVKRADLDAGAIEAHRDNFQDAGWAYCEPAIVRDHASGNARPRRARIFLDRTLSLRIDVREAGERVQVAPDAQFTERQVNMFKNLPFDAPCRSTGMLEKALLDAI